jgi:ion channel-forming bestrophin family protein
MLRSEPGIYYQDLYPLICVLPRYAHAAARGTDADMLPLWKASEWDDTDSDADAGAYGPPMTPAAPTFAASPDGTRANSPASSDAEKPTGARRKPQRSASTATALDVEYALPTIASARPLKPARNPPEATIFDYVPFLRIFKALFSCVRRKTSRGGRRGVSGRMKYPAHVDSNVPLEICLYLTSYHAWLLKKGLLTPALATGIMNNISSLQDSATNLQRIRNTPLPFAYQAHLRMSMWLYLFFLPVRPVFSPPNGRGVEEPVVSHSRRLRVVRGVRSVRLGDDPRRGVRGLPPPRLPRDRPGD